MSLRALVLAAVAAALLAPWGCGPHPSAGPVRTPLDASQRAQDALRSAGLDEDVIDARRQGPDWVVTTRWRETSMAGHIVTVDAGTGAVKVERYRSVQLGGRRPGASPDF